MILFWCFCSLYSNKHLDVKYNSAFSNIITIVCPFGCRIWWFLSWKNMRLWCLWMWKNIFVGLGWGSVKPIKIIMLMEVAFDWLISEVTILIVKVYFCDYEKYTIMFGFFFSRFFLVALLLEVLFNTSVLNNSWTFQDIHAFCIV